MAKATDLPLIQMHQLAWLIWLFCMQLVFGYEGFYRKTFGIYVFSDYLCRSI